MNSIIFKTSEQPISTKIFNSNVSKAFQETFTEISKKGEKNKKDDGLIIFFFSREKWASQGQHHGNLTASVNVRIKIMFAQEFTIDLFP